MQKLSALFFGNDRDALKKSYFWNMMAAGLNAVFSTVILIILRRTSPLDTAGVFTIAYAVANLFSTVGLFGMRSFQVSDTNEQFSFYEYRRSRVISCALMLAVSAVYAVYGLLVNEYSAEKTAVVCLMCLLKAIDAYEDVYLGFYQAKGRLDVAAKILTARYVVIYIVFFALSVTTRSLVISMSAAVAVAGVLSALSVSATRTRFMGQAKNSGFSAVNVRRLISDCLPLCAVAFLSFYTSNAPKYAIDGVLTDELQAYYGFIAMPVFFVSVLNSFVFQPILSKLAEEWNGGETGAFVSRLKKQCGILLLIIVGALAAGFWLGVPVLNLLYNTDVSVYRWQMMTLLFGGGILAFDGLFLAVLTVIRKQRQILYAHIAVAAAALASSRAVVAAYGISGAAFLFLGLCLALFAALFILTAVNIKKQGARQ